jgi:hypothetical protein
MLIGLRSFDSSEFRCVWGEVKRNLTLQWSSPPPLRRYRFPSSFDESEEGKKKLSSRKIFSTDAQIMELLFKVEVRWKIYSQLQ